MIPLASSDSDSSSVTPGAALRYLSRQGRQPLWRRATLVRRGGNRWSVATAIEMISLMRLLSPWRTTTHEVWFSQQRRSGSGAQ